MTTPHHQARVEQIEITVFEDGERRRVPAWRVFCVCGYVSPGVQINLVDAHHEAHEHEETYSHDDA